MIIVAVVGIKANRFATSLINKKEGSQNLLQFSPFRRWNILLPETILLRIAILSNFAFGRINSSYRNVKLV